MPNILDIGWASNNDSMQPSTIRAFIGTPDYDLSRQFYQALGFSAFEIDEKMTLFHWGPNGPGFYLQNSYVKDWVDNSMLFLEVESVDEWWVEVSQLELPARFKGVRLSEVKDFPWGRQCFLHDPAGILWHVCTFSGVDPRPTPEK